MKRRDFMLTSAGIGLSSTLGCVSISGPKPEAEPRVIPERIGGRTLVELRDEMKKYLFDIHLPFFERGGNDKQYGGFMCILDDKGAPTVDEKYIWFMGRGIWIYSYLYNNFGRDPRWLETARRARDFMVKYMYAGNGRWVEFVTRDGSPKKPVSGVIYDWMFAAEGLIEFYKAAGNKEDLDLAITAIKASAEAYDRSDYKPDGGARIGARVQGHSMLFLNTLRQLTDVCKEPWVEQMLQEHVDAVLHRFYNPEFRISNEYLDHDYGRTNPDMSNIGHSLETRWMIMAEGLRRGDRALFDEAGGIIKDWIPMGWDFNFEGWGGDTYHALDTDEHAHGAVLDSKSMWAHSEILIACLMTLEYTGAPWAADWYGRTMDYIRRVYAHEDRPWSLLAKREGQATTAGFLASGRKDNYHPPRCQMLCIEMLERMIRNEGRLTPFPKGKAA